MTGVVALSAACAGDTGSSMDAGAGVIGDPVAGGQKYREQCAPCHGVRRFVSVRGQTGAVFAVAYGDCLPAIGATG